MPLTFQRGAIAQLGERLICIQEVVGSIPSGSTIPLEWLRQPIMICPASGFRRPGGRVGSIIDQNDVRRSVRFPHGKGALVATAKAECRLNVSEDGHRIKFGVTE